MAGYYLEPRIHKILTEFFELEPKDFELSLWNGRIALQNVHLRIEAIEKFLYEKHIHLPIHIVHGHLRELDITIPWNRLLSQPIEIVIDTLDIQLGVNPPYDPSNTKRENTPTTEDSEHQAVDVKEKDNKVVAADEYSNNAKRNSSGTNKMMNCSKVNGSKENEKDSTNPSYTISYKKRILNNINIKISQVLLKLNDGAIQWSFIIQKLQLASADSNWKQIHSSDCPNGPVITRKLLTITNIVFCADPLDADNKTKVKVYREPILKPFTIRIKVMIKYIYLTHEHVLLHKAECNLSPIQIMFFMEFFDWLKSLITNLIKAFPKKQISSIPITEPFSIDVESSVHNTEPMNQVYIPSNRSHETLLPLPEKQTKIQKVIKIINNENYYNFQLCNESSGPSDMRNKDDILAEIDFDKWSFQELQVNVDKIIASFTKQVIIEGDKFYRVHYKYIGGITLGGLEADLVFVEIGWFTIRASIRWIEFVPGNDSVHKFFPLVIGMLEDGRNKVDLTGSIRFVIRASWNEFNENLANNAQNVFETFLREHPSYREHFDFTTISKKVDQNTALRVHAVNVFSILRGLIENGLEDKIFFEYNAKKIINRHRGYQVNKENMEDLAFVIGNYMSRLMEHRRLNGVVLAWKQFFDLFLSYYN